VLACVVGELRFIGASVQLHARLFQRFRVLEIQSFRVSEVQSFFVDMEEWSWMSLCNRTCAEYVDGLKSFISAAEKDMSNENKMAM
jgi:hypothetical protein